jgi:hypothetical protein
VNAITLMENPYVSVWFHPNTKIVHSRIHQFVSGKEFREFLMVGQAALIKNQAKKWLSDDRSNTVLRKEDVDWGNENWFPVCVKHGWKYWAIVQPQKVLAQARLEELVKEFASHGVTSKFFSDPNDAMTWLERQT